MPHGDDTNGQENGQENGQDNGKDGEETPASAAHYIAALAGELAEIARRNGLDTLSAILEMARLEADRAAEH